MSSPECSPDQQTLVTLSRTNYAEGSLGHAFFPESLEGRQRPAQCLSQPLSLGAQTNAVLAPYVETPTIEAVFNLPHDTMARLPQQVQRRIAKKLHWDTWHLEQHLSMTPAARLIGQVLGEVQGTVPAADEDQLMTTVRGVLGCLTPREQRIVHLRYGIDSWHPTSVNDTAHLLGMTSHDVTKLETTTLSKLRHPNFGYNSLRLLSTFPTHSVARIFGLTYRRELMPAPITIAELRLADTTKQELYLRTRSPRLKALLTPPAYQSAQPPRMPSDFRNFVSDDLGGPLPPHVAEDVRAGVTRALRHYQHYQVYGELLGAVSSPYGHTGVVASTSVGTLPLSTEALQDLKQNHVPTLGMLLHIDRDASGRVSSLAPQTVREVGGIARKLYDYLGVLTEQLPPHTHTPSN
ncbi:MAG TPA: sigma factor-like helix-turn-helix DNA-binding protein [Candidatus Saccharimonadales bacterium]|nr:sigma factor-like helix-turn-helix DNA-binding protein [Candidatus Saccharimonadales bacterium]